MKILCLGDSLTDCNRLFSDDPLGEGYVSILNHCAENQHLKYTFLNRGVDGFTVSRLLDLARSQYLTLQPDFITILIGINDIALMMNTNRTDSQKLSLMTGFMHNYETLLRILCFSTKNILLIEPFLFPQPEEFLLWEPYRKTMSEKIADLASQYHLSFLPLQAVLSDAAYKEGFSSITTDGVHLTRKGQDILAEQIKPFLFHSDL